MEEVITIESLTKIYEKPRVKAVDNVSFSVYRGEIFGFLGPNGAGKTTTISIMVGLRKPTSGSVRVLGHDPTVPRELDALKERIGFLAQEFSWFSNTTVRETLNYYFKLYDKGDPGIIDRIIELLGLEEHLDKKFSLLSGGLKRRLGVATALVGDPELVFLDEPTTGLDPQARRSVWSALRELKRMGKTVFLTTHYMEEAEQLCDRIAIILDGRIQVLDSPSRIIEKYGGGYTVELPGVDIDAVSPLLEGLSGYKVMFDDVLKIWFSDEEVLYGFLSRVFTGGLRVEFRVRKPSLETAFLNIVGKKISVEGELE